jgi:hypothetical protein
MYLGSGGGGGAGGDGAGRDGAAGGDGAGIVYIGASTITIAGNINVKGSAGATSATAGGGHGGGGSGGAVGLYGATVTLGSSLVDATGGAGIAAGTNLAGSGGGGIGTIYVGYSSSTGSTNPAGTTAALPVFSSLATEQTQSSDTLPTNAVLAYWRMDEGYSTSVLDGYANTYTGTRSGSTLPAWKTEDLCYRGKCLYFDGSTSYVSVASSISGIKSISLWVKPISVSSAALIDLNGTARITVSSGTISTTGLSSAIVYVDGKVSSTLVANQWQNVVVTFQNTTGSAFKMGNYSSTYLNGFMDEIKLYNYTRTAAQAKADANGGGETVGQNQVYLSQNLLAYWALNESSGNAADSSGNALTLTNNGTTTYTNGRFENASTHNGSSQYLSTATTVSGVKTVTFWARPSSTTDNYINLIASTAYITSSSGVVSATGFTAPKIYVNGQLNGLVVASQWNHIVVTSDTGLSVSAFEAGRANGSYLSNTSKLDDIRLYGRAFSAFDVSGLYGYL